MNIVILQGRLTKDVETKITNNNTKIATWTLAVNRTYGEETDFINCITFNKTAEIAEKYLSKGMLVLLTGSMQIRKWKDEQGNNREKTEIVVNDINFTGNKKTTETETKVEEKVEEVEEEPQQESFYYGDELPF